MPSSFFWGVCLMAGMQKPNWFDGEFEGPMENSTAEQALAQIAKCPRVIQAVKDALADRDANIKKAKGEKHVWGGPSKTQTVRKAVADVLQATD